MARPIQQRSLDGATSATAGAQVETGGRITASLFVVAENLDPANDTLEVELNASMDGNNWDGVSRLQTAEGEGSNLIASDFTNKDGDGAHAAFVSVHGVAARYLRADIAEYTDSSAGDLSVTAWVGVTSNSKTPKDYREVTGQ